MLKVLINGSHVYSLVFGREIYGYQKSKYRNSQGKRRASSPLYETFAYIFIAKGKPGDPPLQKVSVRQFHKDKYSPEEARKAVLKVLLNADEHEGPVYFNRVERAAIWSAYHSRPRPVTTAPGTVPPAGVPASKADAGADAADTVPEVHHLTLHARGNDGHRIVNYAVTAKAS